MDDYISDDYQYGGTGNIDTNSVNSGNQYLFREITSLKQKISELQKENDMLKKIGNNNLQSENEKLREENDLLRKENNNFRIEIETCKSVERASREKDLENEEKIKSLIGENEMLSYFSPHTNDKYSYDTNLDEREDIGDEINLFQSNSEQIGGKDIRSIILHPDNSFYNGIKEYYDLNSPAHTSLELIFDILWETKFKPIAERIVHIVSNRQTYHKAFAVFGQNAITNDPDRMQAFLRGFNLHNVFELILYPHENDAMKEYYSSPCTDLRRNKRIQAFLFQIICMFRLHSEQTDLSTGAGYPVGKPFLYQTYHTKSSRYYFSRSFGSTLLFTVGALSEFFEYGNSMYSSLENIIKLTIKSIGEQNRMNIAELTRKISSISL